MAHRWRLAPLVCLLALAGIAAAEAPVPDRHRVPAVHAEIAVPAGEGWTATKGTRAGGITWTRWTHTERQEVREVLGFPLPPDAQVEPFWRRAVDGLVRAAGADGVGFGPRAATTLWGRAAYDGAFEAAPDSARRQGWARLVATAAGHGAFAWGWVPHPAQDAATADWVRSLQPTRPAFHDPLPRPQDPEGIFWKGPAAEPPLLGAHVDIVLDALEAGQDVVLAHRDRQALRACVQRHIQQMAAPGRASLRGLLAEQQDAERPTEERAKQLATVGRTLWEGYQARAPKGDPIAMCVRAVFHRALRPALTGGGKVVPATHLGAERELREFLRAVLLDGAAPFSPDDLKAIAEGWATSMDADPEATRARMATSARSWRALQERWWTTTRTGRHDIRRQLLKAVGRTPTPATAQALWAELHREDAAQLLAGESARVLQEPGFWSALAKGTAAPR